jgi:transposase
MHLNIVKTKNAKQYYVLEGYRNAQGRSTTRIVRKLGSHEQLLKEHDDPEAWARSVVAEMNREAAEGKQKIMVPFSPSVQIVPDEDRLFGGGYLFLQKLFHQLRLDYICKQISTKHEFQYNLSEILGHLVYSRILNPTSKLATFDYVQTFLEKPDYALEDVYRALEIIGDETDYIQSKLYQFSKNMGKRSDGILYYDCTNYYFEIEQERGMAKYGPSKEHRPNPIVEMGLFMDGDGIPLAFCLHDGNTNEQKTLRPLEEQIMRDFGHEKFIVCTDAGLSSAANRKFNNIGERAFITTQSIKKMKGFQRDWALSNKGWRLPGVNGVFDLNEVLADEKLRKKYHNWTFYKEDWFNENDIEQKYIVTFSIKYMDYQRRIRSEQIARAQAALSSENKRDRARQSDYKRFITKIPVTETGEVAEKTVYGLNEEKIRDEERYDGFYAVATNLDDPAEEIIRINHRRWEIEECFRIMKHEFDARPVFLRRDDRIKAHFTTCFLALTLFRYLEKALGHRYTCEQIIKELRGMKFLKLNDAGYVPAYTRTDLTDDLHQSFGFRTDYEIIPKGAMRHIVSHTKKR